MLKKSFLLLLSLMLTSVAVMAQYQLPDPSFEDWSGTPFDGKIQTAHWHFSNVSNVIKVNFAERVSGRTGDYAAKVQDRAMQALGINFGVSPGYFALGYPWVYVPGTDGDAATAGTHAGISWTSRPDSLVVWIKREGANVMRENYNIVFYSWRGTAFAPSYPSKKGCTAIPESTTGLKGGGIEDEESDIRLALDANTCGTQRFATQVAECYFFERAEYTDWTRICIPVYYLCDSVPEKCNLIFSAGNYPAGKSTSGLYAGNSMTVDDVELIYSSKIQKLYINNKEWKGFDPNSTEVQTYSLGAGATTIPSIYAVRGAGQETNCNGQSASFQGRRLNAQECVIDAANAAVDGAPVAITVTAEDGSSTSTYYVQFVSQASSNAMLSDIQVDGKSIANFNPYLTTYTVSLPFGYSCVPEITCTTQDKGATVHIQPGASLSDNTTIVVTAQDGKTTKTYTLSFQVAEANNTLTGILLDDEALVGFAPEKYHYVVELAADKTDAPLVTPVLRYAESVQTVVVEHNSIHQGCTLRVSMTDMPDALYTISYKRASITDPYLQTILLDGDTLEHFNKVESDYTIVLGDKPMPVVTPVAMDSTQQLFVAASLKSGLTSISVVSVTGESFTYHLHFVGKEEEPIDSVSPNVLLALVIDGYGYLDLSQTEERTFTIDLPYGSEDLHVSSWIKSFNRQQVIVAEGGILQPTTLTVIGGREEDERVVYTLIPSVSTINPMWLTDLQADGATVSGFAPNIFSYVMSVESPDALPVFTYSVPDGMTGTVELNTQHWQLTLENEEQEHVVYTVSFHYPSSVIPNADFSQWTATKYNNARKPLGWMAPADAIRSGAGYTTGNEVRAAIANEGYFPDPSEATGTVNLQALFSAFTIAGTVPGIITTGTLHMNLRTFGSSNSWIDGGIAYWNTPDTVVLAYKNINSTRVPNWRFLVNTKGQGAEWQENIALVPYQKFGQWQDVALPLTYNGVPDSINVIINNMHSDNMDDYAGTAIDQQHCELRVRDLRLRYCSSLASVSYDGTILSPMGTQFTHTLDMDDLFFPHRFTFMGDVLDQQHTPLVWTETSTGQWSASFTNYAENGMDHTDYAVSVSRPLSTNVDFAYITRVGEYDLRVKAASPYAVVTADTLQGGFRITLSPESGEMVTTYLDTVPYYTPSSDATLAVMKMNEDTLSGFMPEQTDYVVNYERFADWTSPLLYACPNDSMATLSLTTSALLAEDRTTTYTYSLLVKAEDGTEQTYTLTIHVPAEPLATLDMIYMDGDSLVGFAKDDEEYSFTFPFGTTTFPELTWTLSDATATATLTWNTEPASDAAQEAIIHVEATDGKFMDYHVLYFVLPNDNWHLQSLSVQGVSVPDFHRDSLSYVLTYPIGTPAAALADVEDVLAVPEYEKTVVAVSRESDATLLILCTAENGAFQTYVIKQQITLSSNAELDMIYVEGTPLQDFDPQIVEYTYILPQGAILPSVTAVAADTLAEEPLITMGDTTYIFCTAEDGTELVYVVVFAYAPYNSADEGDIDDCMFVHLDGTNEYLAVTIRTDVKILVCDMLGRRLMLEAVPVCDPNYVQVEIDENGNPYIADIYPGATGVRFTANYNQPYLAVFLRSGKRLAKGIKFMLIP